MILSQTATYDWYSIGFSKMTIVAILFFIENTAELNENSTSKASIKSRVVFSTKFMFHIGEDQQNFFPEIWEREEEAPTGRRKQNGALTRV